MLDEFQNFVFVYQAGVAVLATVERNTNRCNMPQVLFMLGGCQFNVPITFACVQVAGFGDGSLWLHFNVGMALGCASIHTKHPIHDHAEFFTMVLFGIWVVAKHNAVGDFMGNSLCVRVTQLCSVMQIERDKPFARLDTPQCVAFKFPFGGHLEIINVIPLILGNRKQCNELGDYFLMCHGGVFRLCCLVSEASMPHRFEKCNQ